MKCGGEIMAWARISVGGHDDLEMFCDETLTVVRYRDPHVCQSAATTGDNFNLMADNPTPH